MLLILSGEASFSQQRDDIFIEVSRTNDTETMLVAAHILGHEDYVQIVRDDSFDVNASINQEASEHLATVDQVEISDDSDLTIVQDGVMKIVNIPQYETFNSHSSIIQTADLNDAVVWHDTGNYKIITTDLLGISAARFVTLADSSDFVVADQDIDPGSLPNDMRNMTINNIDIIKAVVGRRIEKKEKCKTNTKISAVSGEGNNDKDQWADSYSKNEEEFGYDYYAYIVQNGDIGDADLIQSRDYNVREISQIGTYNFADVVQIDNWNEVYVYQSGVANTVSIIQTGISNASNPNIATITQHGTSHSASITQSGAGNYAEIYQTD
jgi:hypothetical protein